MKFFHVYNETCFEGLVKNNFINRDTGFKIQHCFAVPKELKFNSLAAVGSPLHSLIKEGSHPFYVDRLAGGITYHSYDFDEKLIDEYKALLGDWFLGFQLHESASNRNNDWKNLAKYMDGQTGPFDLEELKKKCIRKSAVDPDGNLLPGFSQGTPEEYAPMRKAETVSDFIEEIRELYKKFLSQSHGNILPCDSYFLFTRLQGELGMRTFMPEVGCQISDMRIAVALARGMAKVFLRTWGTYYETWMESPDDHTYSMPHFNPDPGNEWYLTAKTHTDDFLSFGERGGSSRHLQKRIYYHTLMSGADYMAEEWGLNCSYADMNTFELSPYGRAKKDFIDFTQQRRGIRAVIPFAIILPREYECVEISDAFGRYPSGDLVGEHRNSYMHRIMSAAERAVVNHVEDVLGAIYSRDKNKALGTEGHTLTNSQFGDLFDIIYEDAPDEALNKYYALIDASADGGFAEEKKNGSRKIFTSEDLEKTCADIKREAKAILPCYVDSLLWLLSEDECGRSYVSIFNNEGNNRNLKTGDEIIRKADATATLTFSTPREPKCVKHGAEAPTVNKTGACTYKVKIPASGFAIFEY